MDCGPTCLRMVAKYYGKNISLKTLRAETQIGKEGVNLLGISEAAEKTGFRTRAVKLSFKELINDSIKPAIIHWDQNHFVVLTPTIKKNKITRADPGKASYALLKMILSKTGWLRIMEKVKNKNQSLM